MGYDSAIISYTTKTDKVDLVQAAHMNAVQNELVTIETILGTNLKGSSADLSTRLNVCLGADGAINRGTAFPSGLYQGQLFYRTDEDLLYAFDGTGWDAAGKGVSNVIYAWRGTDGQTGASAIGFYNGTDQTPAKASNLAENHFYMYGISNSNGYNDWIAWKWTKVDGVNTLTVNAKAWFEGTNVDNVSIRLAVNTTLTGDSANFSDSTPTWQSAFTVDVSSLVNGTTYDIVLQAHSDDSSGDWVIYLSALIVEGS